MLTAEGAAGNTYSQLQTVLGLPKDLQYIRESYSLIQQNFQWVKHRTEKESLGLKCFLPDLTLQQLS